MRTRAPLRHRRGRQWGEKAVIWINAKLFLIIIELLLVFFVLAVIMFFLYRKHAAKGCAYREKNQEVLSKWKDFSVNLKSKFEQSRNLNTKLQGIIKSLPQDNENADEYKKIMTEFEKSNKDFDRCIDTLEKENAELDKKLLSYEAEVDALTRKLKRSVNQAEFNMVAAQKERIAEQAERLQEQLDNKIKECEALENSHSDLENNRLEIEKKYKKLENANIELDKEYKALYRKHEGSEEKQEVGQE